MSSLFDGFFCYMQWLENFVEASTYEVGIPNKYHVVNVLTEYILLI
jgi:hypothetical protein